MSQGTIGVCIHSCMCTCCRILHLSATVARQVATPRTVLASSISLRYLTGVRIGVVKETTAGENRVIITPPNVAQLIKKDAKVSVESVLYQLELLC